MRKQRIVRRWVAGAMLLGALACGGEPPVTHPVVPEDPGEALRALETRLGEADSFRVSTEIRADGVVRAALSGRVSMGPGTVDLAHDGTFVGNPARLFLGIEDGRLVGGNGDHRFDTEVPPALREAIVLGMTRMGILHNLARLTGAMPPDHGEGDLDAWLETIDVRWLKAGPDAAGRCLAFSLRVDGQDAADVRLWLDAGSGLPIRREQTTRFPQGTMAVVEEYRDWAVEDRPAGDR